MCPSVIQFMFLINRLRDIFQIVKDLSVMVDVKNVLPIQLLITTLKSLY